MGLTGATGSRTHTDYATGTVGTATDAFPDSNRYLLFSDGNFNIEASVMLSTIVSMA